MFKFIYTLGPASNEPSIIQRLMKNAGSFRLNSSHLTPSQLNDWLLMLQGIFTKVNKSVPVVIDLQGSKMRIGNINPLNSLPKTISFTLSQHSSNATVIPVPHKGFFSAIKEHSIVTLNDAKISIQITYVNPSNYEASGEVLQNGPLSSNKGVNIHKHPVTLSELSEKDKEIIKTSLQYKFTEFAYSFTLDGSEAKLLKAITDNRRIIAKIERCEAFNHINAIDKSFDEIWLCRGDLGAQAGLENLGKLQKQFTNIIPKMKHECILAGQLLEHMTFFSSPTRSEVVHLFDTYHNGYKGIVLSDETAVGKNPTKVAKFLELISTTNF